jgi:PKD repeat protein
VSPVIKHMKALIKSAFVLLGAVALSSCTLKNADAPPLTGPSELGTSVSVQVSPDILPTDGGSQALVTIIVRDANGQPVPNKSLRTEIYVNGAPTDFGTLSAKNVVTDASGKATVVYTAPSVNTGGVDAGLNVQIAATPIGTDANSSIARTVTVRLVPVGFVVPASGLVPSFTNTPNSARDNENMVFDASASKSNGLAPIAEYRWNFGDGATGSGVIANHSFSSAGTFSVTLTIVDTLGRTAAVTRAVTITPGLAPEAEIVFSPPSPRPGQLVIFNGAASQPAPGRTIVSYEWSFGDGATATGEEATHVYTTAGSYRAVLKVTDNAGRADLADALVVVGATNPTAVFVNSPTQPRVAQTITFNASASTAGAGRTIVSYAWDFGDGTTGTGVQFSKAGGYTAAGTYTVTLVVTDDQGNKGVVSQTITISP